MSTQFKPHPFLGPILKEEDVGDFHVQVNKISSSTQVAVSVFDDDIRLDLSDFVEASNLESYLEKLKNPEKIIEENKKKAKEVEEQIFRSGDIEKALRQFVGGRVRINGNRYAMRRTAELYSWGDGMTKCVGQTGTLEEVSEDACIVTVNGNTFKWHYTQVDVSVHGEWMPVRRLVDYEQRMEGISFADVEDNGESIENPFTIEEVEETTTQPEVQHSSRLTNREVGRIEREIYGLVPSTVAISENPRARYMTDRLFTMTSEMGRLIGQTSRMHAPVVNNDRVGVKIGDVGYTFHVSNILIRDGSQFRRLSDVLIERTGITKIYTL